MKLTFDTATDFLLEKEELDVSVALMLANLTHEAVLLRRHRRRLMTLAERAILRYHTDDDDAAFEKMITRTLRGAFVPRLIVQEDVASLVYDSDPLSESVSAAARITRAIIDDTVGFRYRSAVEAIVDSLSAAKSVRRKYDANRMVVRGFAQGWIDGAGCDRESLVALRQGVWVTEQDDAQSCIMPALAIVGFYTNR